MSDDLKREGFEDQVKGTVEEGEGRLKNAVGGLTGDTSKQLKGKAQELKGKVRRKIGEAESDADRDV
ncbi:MAG: CsbD family protein [Gemmatimonadaceae bacterium]